MIIHFDIYKYSKDLLISDLTPLDIFLSKFTVHKSFDYY